MTSLRSSRQLAAKGIAPNVGVDPARASDAISMGKTLLQKVIEARVDQLKDR